MAMATFAEGDRVKFKQDYSIYRKGDTVYVEEPPNKQGVVSVVPRRGVATSRS